MLIDAHVHVWSPARGDYGWLRPDDVALYRDFSIADYADAMASRGVDGVVLVQAAPTLAETVWLLEIARTEKLVSGVVGWVDFDAPVAPDTLAALADDRLVGVRPMLQDLDDPTWMLRSSFDAVYNALATSGMVFDALVRPVHLPMLRMLAERHPALTIVLDHLGKPSIASDTWQPWADDVAALAACPNVVCKLSGLLTEAGTRDRAHDMARYVEHALACFGSERLIWGSDWPVVTKPFDPGAWLDMAEAFLGSLTSIEHEAIFGGNAARIYRLTARGAV